VNSNTVHNKIIQFAKPEEVSLSVFKSMLKSSSQYSKIRVTWTTEEGNEDTYYFYWDSAKYKGGSAGGSETKEDEGMVNLQGDGFSGDWRTLTYSTVTEFRFRGKNYKIK
jgi:hypothetical protein